MEFMSASRQLEANFVKINLIHTVSVLVLDTRTHWYLSVSKKQFA